MDCVGGLGMGEMMVWMLLWAVVGLAVLSALVVGAVWLVRRTNGGGSPDGPESAEEILRRRLAAGEIDEDKYYRLRAALKE
jgi:putative membrane protein